MCMSVCMCVSSCIATVVRTKCAVTSSESLSFAGKWLHMKMCRLCVYVCVCVRVCRCGEKRVRLADDNPSLSPWWFRFHTPFSTNTHTLWRKRLRIFHGDSYEVIMMMDFWALWGGKLCFSWRQSSSEEDAVCTGSHFNLNIKNSHLNNQIWAHVYSSLSVPLV